MQMTTFKLLLLRVYNMTVGRFSWGDRFLRQELVKVLVKSKGAQQRYTASARCFDMRQLLP
jgi:hypothetical protein